MKNAPQLLVLAAFLFAAAPVFADRTPIEFRFNNRDSFFAKGAVNKKETQSPQTFNLNALEQDNGRIGSTFDARINVLSEDAKSSELDALLTSGTREHFHAVKLFDFDTNNANSFREDDNGKIREKHHRKFIGSGNGTSVSVSEPASGRLLLFGLVGLGLLFCRRNVLRPAV